ncbi:MAG: chorismate synthase [Sphingobacteriia bacterium]|nr:MAG: chorismate synthase [Sphingobacteriia bacterium]
MNSLGTLFRVSILGESHGEMAGVLLDGCPAGLPLSTEEFMPDLIRRQGGNQKGTTPRKERDEPHLLTGVFNGFTTGAPLLIRFDNNNTRSSDYDQQRTHPRPGHADFTAHHKYGGFEDYRGGGHFSGRLTVGLVAAGVIAKKILALSGVKVTAKILSIGGEQDLEKGLQKAIAAKDSIGGLVECEANGLPIGWGEHFFDSLESLISHAVFAIPAIKGIEFGTGFAAAHMTGLEHNDAIASADGKTKTNHAGGIVGGISNGNPLVFRVAVKPTSSTPQVQNSLNWDTGLAEDFAIRGRHDLCIALRVPVVLEAVTAMVLVDAQLRAGALAPIKK